MLLCYDIQHQSYRSVLVMTLHLLKLPTIFFVTYKVTFTYHYMMRGYIAIIVETFARGYRDVFGWLIPFFHISFFLVICSFADNIQRQRSKRLSGHISTSKQLELCGGHMITSIQYYLTRAHYAHTVHSTYACPCMDTNTSGEGGSWW